MESVEERGKKPKKKVFPSFMSMAYVVLLRDRIAANPEFTGAMLNAELTQVAEQAATEMKKGKK
jgi:hypothetical protein